MQSPSSLLSEAGIDPESAALACGLDDIDRCPVRLAPPWMRRMWPRAVSAMTLPWGIYVDPGVLGLPGLGRLLVHELVHVRQWRQLGIFRFLVRYLADYLLGRMRGLGHTQAYRGIRMEVEARSIAGV